MQHFTHSSSCGSQQISFFQAAPAGADRARFTAMRARKIQFLLSHTRLSLIILTTSFLSIAFHEGSRQSRGAAMRYRVTLSTPSSSRSRTQTVSASASTTRI